MGDKYTVPGTAELRSRACENIKMNYLKYFMAEINEAAMLICLSFIVFVFNCQLLYGEDKTMKIKPDLVVKEISDKEIFRGLTFLVLNEKYLAGTYHRTPLLDMYAHSSCGTVQYLEIGTGKIESIVPGKRYFTRQAIYSCGKIIQGADRWSADEKLSYNEAAGLALDGNYEKGFAVINSKTMKIENIYSRDISENNEEGYSRLYYLGTESYSYDAVYFEEKGKKVVYFGYNDNKFQYIFACYDLENKKFVFVKKISDDASLWTTGKRVACHQKQIIIRMLMLPGGRDDRQVEDGYKTGWWESKENNPKDDTYTRIRIKKILDKFSPTLICNDFDGKELWKEEIQDTLKEGDFFEHYDTGLFPSGDLWAVVQNNFLVYDIASHKKKFHHKAGTDKAIRRVLEIKPGSLYALACDDNTIKFVDIKKGEVLKLTDIDYTANDLKAKGEKPESIDKKFYPDMIMWDTLDIINDPENKFLAVHPRLKNNILLLDLQKILKEIESH